MNLNELKEELREIEQKGKHPEILQEEIEQKLVDFLLQDEEIRIIWKDCTHEPTSK